LAQKPQLKEGDIVNGSYRVLAKIGTGGMGAVYKVEHVKLKRLFALKTLEIQGNLLPQHAVWKRFQQEAQTISKLSHKSIIQVYDFSLTEDGAAYYVMDFVDGKTLQEAVRKEGQLEIRQALGIFIEVAYGLAYAHSLSLVHRDIKPSNIMLVENAAGTKSGNVKIVDFGLAKFGGKTSTGVDTEAAPVANLQLQGSPPYMSPEQFQTNDVDYRSDIYSFGCTLFEALTGVPPFIGESALVLSMKHINEPPPSLTQASMGRDFAPELEMIEGRLLAKDPNQRYQDMKVVADDLKILLDKLDQPGRPQERQKSDENGGSKISGSSEEKTSKNAGARSGRNSARNSGDNTSSGTASANKAQTTLEHNQDITVTPLPQARAARRFIFIAAFILIGSSLALTIVITTHQQRPPAQPPNAKVSPTASFSPTATVDENRALDGKANKEPFSDIIVSKSGKKMRVFQFPEEISLGRILDKDNESNLGFEAKGRLEYGAGKRLRFIPDFACCNSPSYFRRFKSDDLYELDLTQNETVTSETLNYIDHLSSLKKLSLIDTEVDNDCLPTIDQLKALDTLDVSDTNITGAALAKLKVLHQLEAIRFNQLLDVSPLISALKASPKLIDMHADGTTLTKQDLDTIASFKNLEVLSVCSTKIGRSGLEILSRSPKLTQLVIISDGFGADIIPVLKKYKILKFLRINCDTWSQADVDKLKSSLPGVLVRIADKYKY
jgi:serine/threonine protein kinase